MDWRDAKDRLLQDKGRKEAYEKVDLGYEIGKMVTDARIAKNMTQERLANLIGTKQPSIARIERGSYLPSLSFLLRIADAFGTQLLAPRLQFLEENRVTYTFNRPTTFWEYVPSWEVNHVSDFMGTTPTRSMYAF